MRYLIGADIGTTSMKIILLNERGEVILSLGENYELSRRNSLEAELDGDTYWIVFKNLIKRLLDIHPRIKDSPCAIAVDSQGETLILTDREGKPLRNAIVWLDNRAGEEATDISLAFPRDLIYKITGQPESVPTWPASKILWLRKHERENFRKTHKFLMVSDYINYRLTGQYVTDRSVSSSTLYFDINKNTWWEDMLNHLGISGNNLPEMKSSGDLIGAISPEASRETGLGLSTNIYAGALDQMASAVGAGNIGSDRVSESTGTCLALCVNTEIHDKTLYKSMIPCHAHAVKDKYCLLFWSQTAGVILEWFKNNFCDSMDYVTLDRLAESVAPGSEGLVVLPHFEGTAVPDFNPRAGGVFFGVRLKHGKAHFHRAIMEATAYMLKEHLDLARSMGININEIISIGGGANSPLWNRIKADVTGRGIRVLENSETAAMGSAIIAGAGAGIFSDLEDGIRKCVKTKMMYYPREDNHRIYQETFKRYKLLYESLKNMYG